MYSKIYQLLSDPYHGNELTIVSFDSNEAANGIITNGLLLNKDTGAIYPIINKTPILIKNRIPSEFYLKNKNNFLQYSNLQNIEQQLVKTSKEFSFSKEWEQFHNDKMEKTWGWTAQERLEQFYIETQTNEEEIENKIILDAGCGNGLLTQKLASKTAIAIGIDYSESIFQISSNNTSSNLLYIQGDLQFPPLKEESIDIIISNGVIHHTKSTKHTFKQVAKLVKQEGKFYLWLYRRPFQLYHTIFNRITDLLRFCVNKLPNSIQNYIVNGYTHFFFFISKIKKKKVDFYKLRIDAYDTLTPQYKHYHHSYEVAEWFHECGFDSPLLTHWDNPNGFGMYSTKRSQKNTAGFNYNNENPKKRYSTV